MHTIIISRIITYENFIKIYIVALQHRLNFKTPLARLRCYFDQGAFHVNLTPKIRQCLSSSAPREVVACADTLVPRLWVWLRAHINTVAKVVYFDLSELSRHRKLE